MLGVATPIFAQNPTIEKRLSDLLDLPAPRSAALELAAILRPSKRFPSFDNNPNFPIDENKILENLPRFLRINNECDQKNQNCLLFSKEIAKKISQLNLKSAQNFDKDFIYKYASVIQSDMSNQEIKKTIDFLKSSSGVKFFNVIKSESIDLSMLIYGQFLTNEYYENLNKLSKEYEEKTKNFPRGKGLILAPPPPLPPKR